MRFSEAPYDRLFLIVTNNDFLKEGTVGFKKYHNGRTFFVDIVNLEIW